MNFFFCMLKVCLLCWYWHFSELQIHCVSIQKQASKADYGLLKDIRVKRPRLSSSFFLCSKYIQNLEVNNPFPKGPRLSFRPKGENISRSWGKKERYYPLHLFLSFSLHHLWDVMMQGRNNDFCSKAITSVSSFSSVCAALGYCSQQLWSCLRMPWVCSLSWSMQWGKGRSSAPYRYRASGSPSSQNKF